MKDSGLVTLEWLLIVASTAAFAAAATLIATRVVDRSRDIPADPAVGFIAADIAATRIAVAADRAALADEHHVHWFQQCQQLADAYPIEPFSPGDWTPPATWFPPTTLPTSPPSVAVAPPDPSAGPQPQIWTHAKCAVTALSN